MITLKNSKVYVGFLIFADYGDLNGDQKSIRILPIKSGIRNNNGGVKYTTYYPIPEKDDIYTSKNDLPLEDEKEKEKIILESGLLDLPEIILFQREIISYTVFNPDLDLNIHQQNLSLLLKK